jgi:hypothetical protein
MVNVADWEWKAQPLASLVKLGSASRMADGDALDPVASSHYPRPWKCIAHALALRHASEINYNDKDGVLVALKAQNSRN